MENGSQLRQEVEDYSGHDGVGPRRRSYSDKCTFYVQLMSVSFGIVFLSRLLLGRRDVVLYLQQNRSNLFYNYN